MGKAKKHLKKGGGGGADAKTSDAAGVKDAAPEAEQKQAPIPAVMKLKKPDGGVVLQGCRDCASLSLQDDASAAQLARGGAAPALLDCMEHDNLQIRVAACQGLRNLVLGAGAVLAQQFAATESAGPLRLRKIFGESWQEFARLRAGGVVPSAPKRAEQAQDAQSAAAQASGDDAGMDVSTEEPMDTDRGDGRKLYRLGGFLSELVQLLGAVVFHSQGAAAVVSDPSVISALVSCSLTDPECGVGEGRTQPLSVAAAECILTLAEDNEAVLGVLRALPQDAQQQLVGALRGMLPAPPATRAALAGFLWQVDRALLPDSLKLLCELIAAAPTPQAAYATLQPVLQRPTEDAAGVQMREDRRGAVRMLKDVLQTALSASQNLSNIVASAEAVEGEDDEVSFARTEVGQLFAGLGIAAGVGGKALSLLADPPGGCYEVPVLADARSLFGGLNAALTSLVMNLLIVMPCAAVGDPAALWTVMAGTFDRCTAAIRTGSDDDLARCAASAAQCLWTVRRKDDGRLAAATTESVLPLCGATGRLLGRENAETEDAFVNALGLLGCLGEGLSNDQGPQRAAAVGIAQLFLRALAEKSLAVNLEAFNSIVDVFADDGWDDVMREQSMLPRMAAVATALEAKVAVLLPTGAVPEDLFPRLELVQANLGPFLEYKQQRLA